MAKQLNGNMKDYHVIKKDKNGYSTSAWSGGATTELQIKPEGSCYADRSFLWRLSSATVELEESNFTPLPDYDRWIMMLKGEVELSHNNSAWIHLNEFEPHFFDGGDETVSRGKAVDFNLMLRKGKNGGDMLPFVFKENGEKTWEAPIQCCDSMIYCYEGRLSVLLEDESRYELTSGESLFVSGELSGMKWKLDGNAGTKSVIAAVWNL